MLVNWLVSVKMLFQNMTLQKKSCYVIGQCRSFYIKMGCVISLALFSQLIEMDYLAKWMFAELNKQGDSVLTLIIFQQTSCFKVI